jgi:hypothetical protein
MFDAFDIWLPELPTCGSFEVRPEQTAFGASEELFAFVDGRRFCAVLTGNAANLAEHTTATLGSAHCRLILLAGGAAEAAAGDDERWKQFLHDLTTVLAGYKAWRVTWEADCDQYPMKRLELSVDQVSELLNDYRRTQRRPIAFEVTSKRSFG